MRRALVPRELHDRALRREVAAEHAERAARLERLILPSRSPRRPAPAPPAACSAIVRPSTVGASPCRCGSSCLITAAVPPALVQVARDETTARGQARHDRRRRREAIEVFELERDAGLVGDRQQVQHGVRRAAGSGDADDRVLERRPSSRARTAGRRARSRRGRAARRHPPPLPWPGRPRERCRGRSGRVRESRSRPPSCSP